MAPIRRPHYTPRYRIHIEDLSHAAATEFLKLPVIGTMLQHATNEVFRVLYEDHGTPVSVRSVTLILESMGGVAYTTGIPLDDLHKEIHVSLEYLSSQNESDDHFREECVGVITHEMVHCWQHNSRGSAPGGLIEGIADFVRLKAGLAPPHWKKSKQEAGKRWDEGYQKTAYFLEWLEDKYGHGTVSRMNASMDGQYYDEERFWNGLFGASVHDLWNKYLDHYDEKKDEQKEQLELRHAKEFSA